MNIPFFIKSGLPLLAITLALTTPTHAAGDGWTADFAAAKKEAAASGKDLLIDFTGSDWCSWCITLDKEVFSQAPFKTGVADRFILVELDYLNDKSVLTPELLAQNEALGKQYQVSGYPTVLLCDPEGKPYASTGYLPGGPEAYLKHLDELQPNKAARDTSLAAAAKLEGLEKARALVATLTAMEIGDEMRAHFYADLIAEIKTLDPEDKTGFAQSAAMKQRIQEAKIALGGHMQKKDYAAAIAFLDKTIAEGGFDDENIQQMMMTRGLLYGDLKQFGKAIEALDQAIAFAPDSEWAPRIEESKKRFTTP